MGNMNALVSIRCLTYNQSAYITDAFNGFVQQQTNFPFLAVVVDDSSTDGEQDVIKAYLDANFSHLEETGYRRWETTEATWIIARHKENTNCYFVVVFLKKNLYGNPKKLELIKEWADAKYLAFCEGDDYWIDPMKLQKQVDFLESHEDFTMCFHGSDIRNESLRDVQIRCDKIETREYFPNDVFPTWVPHISSFLCRTETIERFRIRHEEWLESGDTVKVLICMHLGRVWGMEEHMSVYRMNDYSVMSQVNDIKAIGRYVQHLKCFLLNFPKIDKEYCYKEICTYDYARFKKRDGEKNRWYYLWDAVVTSPQYMWRMQKRKVKALIKPFVKRIADGKTK